MSGVYTLHGVKRNRVINFNAILQTQNFSGYSNNHQIKIKGF